MGDVAKGVKSFKKGINDDDESNSINKSEDNSNKE
jgi:Sec-independent protein translocase protein TatA